jgi:hypothetical protein
MLCHTCYQWIRSKKKDPPKNSISSGVDFGCWRRIPALQEPNLHEQAILALYRQYSQVVKIRSNQQGTVNYTHYKLQAHPVLFAHDAPIRAAESINEMLHKDNIKDALMLQFIAPANKIDLLIRQTVGMSNLLARAHVILQHLLIY